MFDINYLVIIQARLGSKRFPNKILTKIKGKTVLEIIYERISKSKKIDKIVFAIPQNLKNNKLNEFLISKKYEVFRGSEKNVLKRYYDAASIYNPKNIIRITGDSPLIDYKLIEKLININDKNNIDYISNVNPATFPDGLDTEIFSHQSFKKVYKLAKSKYDKEHVSTFYHKNNFFKKINVENKIDLSNLRFTLDQYEDLELISKIFKKFSPNIHFRWTSVVNLINKKIIYPINNIGIKRNAGSNMKKGQKLYIRAKNIIPGGNMFLSKKPEMFLPNLWPSYFSKSKGCYVWDLDKNKYLDVSLMGVGTNVLGYANNLVDKDIQKSISNGVSSTLNCSEEVQLAEKLLDINPWFDMVRFTRTGAEANAVAIRIARAASGKDNVAICGYHGWHDWYLSANRTLNNNLDSHLLPGLDPLGVPKKLKNTTFTFKYNDLDKLKKLVKNKNIGVVKMEVERNIPPKNNFLNEVRKLCTKNGIVLIFDECTTGFRKFKQGLHHHYNIKPDILLYGKSMGNGYAINAIIGKREFMKYAQFSFISSTFWSERIGPTAALSTIKIMNQINSFDKITKISNKISKEIGKIAKDNGIELLLDNTPTSINFRIDIRDWMSYKTYLTQEMLNNKILAGPSIFVCIDHKDNVMQKYYENLNKIFNTFGKYINSNQNIEKLLTSDVCQSGFARLN